MVSYFSDSVNKTQTLKKIKDPDDEDSFVLIPVTDQISFKDPKTEGQEIVIRFDLTEDGGRIFHVRRVKRKTGTPDDYEEDDEQFIEVERPDAVGVIDRKTNAQGYGFRFDNKDTENSWPALPGVLKGFNLETVRHVVRYTADNTLDGEPWVDVELIDLFQVRDPKSDAQVHIYRITYAAKGDLIDDPDDPYEPTFAIADRNLPTVDSTSTIIDPPYRTSPLENIVNVGLAGVVEFQTDTEDPHTHPYTRAIIPLSGLAVQEEAEIEDFKKATWSIFFNTARDMSGEFEPNHFMLMQWGGRKGTNTDIAGLGYPASSSIKIGPTGREIAGTAMAAIIYLQGPVFSIESRPLTSFWDAFGYINPFQHDTSQATNFVLFNAMLGGINPLWRQTLGTTFLDKWHHLLISMDASDADFESADVEYIYIWSFELIGIPALDGGGNPTGALPTGGTRLEWLTEIEDNGGPLASMIPYGGTATIDVRPNHFDIETSLPDADDLKRAIVIYAANAEDAARYGGFGVIEGSALAQTWATRGSPTFANLDDVKFHVMVDGKLYKGDPGATPPVEDPEGVTELQLGFVYESENIADYGEDGFIIGGDEIEPLGIPRQKRTGQPYDFDPPPDVRKRMSKVQVWFNKYVDLAVQTNVDKFITRFTDDLIPGVTFLKPAAFTADERTQMENNNVPQELRLSPASLAFGEPSLYQDGGPAKFLINRGSEDDFIKINDIESFSPGPKKIPLAT